MKTLFLFLLLCVGSLRAERLSSEEVALLKLFTSPESPAAGKPPMEYLANIQKFVESDQFKKLEQGGGAKAMVAVCQLARESIPARDRFRELLAFYSVAERDVAAALEVLKQEGVMLSGAQPTYQKPSAPDFLEPRDGGLNPLRPGSLGAHQTTDFLPAWELVLLMPDSEARALLWTRTLGAVLAMSPERTKVASQLLIVRSFKTGRDSRVAKRFSIDTDESSYLFRAMMMAAGKESAKAWLELRDLLNAEGDQGAPLDEWLSKKAVFFLSRSDEGKVKLSNPHFDPYVAASWTGFRDAVGLNGRDEGERGLVSKVVAEVEQIRKAK
jgi:hypothetical protein